MNFLEKLDFLMGKMKINKRKLSQISGVPYTTIDGFYKKGYENTKISTIRKIASALDVSLDYLVDESISDEHYRPQIKKSPSDISEEAKKLAQDYDQHLDTWGQKAVRGLTDTEMARVASAEPEEGSTPPKDEKPATRVTALPKVKRRRDGFTEIEVYDQPAAAGLGNYLDTPPSHMEQYPAELVPDRTDFGVLISGDSMEPNIPNGSTVFVQSAPTVDAGEIGIFVLDGKSYCKMLSVDHDRGQVRLVSINPAYADIPIGEADELRTLGRVLGHYVPRRWE